MKRFVSIILFSAMLLSVAACSDRQTANADTTAAPTEEVTAAPTEAPTTAPTAAMTEEPTPEPTAVPDPIELDFRANAEIAVKLPWGDGENEVFRKDYTGEYEDDDWVIPMCFSVTDGKAYIIDRYYPYGNGMLRCDIESGAAERLGFDSELFNYNEFAVMDGMLIFKNRIIDMATGKVTNIQSMTELNDGDENLTVHQMKARDGCCYAYVGKDSPAAPFLDEYQLDIENSMWVLVRRLEMPENVPHPRLSGRGGSSDRYMGTDAEGNHYVDSLVNMENADGTWTGYNRISKISPEGCPISYIDVYYPDDFLEMEIPQTRRLFFADDDGTVWFMCETKTEFLIYRISMEPRTIKLDFEDCAEEIVRFKWGEGELEAYRELGNESEDMYPRHFFTDGSRVYIYDRWVGFGGEAGLLVYDTETGKNERTSVRPEGFWFHTEFAVMDGKLITANAIFDLSTGEQTDIQPLVQTNHGSNDHDEENVSLMLVRDGKCYAYVDTTSWAPVTKMLTEYVLDTENLMWRAVRQYSQPTNGGGIHFLDPDVTTTKGRFIGTDAEGNIFVDSGFYEEQPDGSWESYNIISKYAPDGRLIAELRVPFPENYAYQDIFWVFRLDNQGNVWFMCNTKDDGLIVYRINM